MADGATMVSTNEVTRHAVRQRVQTRRLASNAPFMIDSLLISKTRTSIYSLTKRLQQTGGVRLFQFYRVVVHQPGRNRSTRE
jgi:hypothetical protein